MKNGMTFSEIEEWIKRHINNHDVWWDDGYGYDKNVGKNELIEDLLDELEALKTQAVQNGNY